MNTYIAFLVLIFVLAAVAPRMIRRPWVVLLLCIALCMSFYSTRFFG